MNEHDIAEQAYKNGYEAGKADAVKHGLNGCEYGEFVYADKNDIQKAKKILLEQMIETIKQLAKRDDFWIVTHLNETIFSCLCENPNTVTVGWKIHIPHMTETEKENG